MGASYRRLGVPSLEALNGAGVYYGGATSEAPALVGREVFIVGGANSAGQAALHLARYAKRVTLVVRAPSLRAGMSEYLVRQVEATENIEVRLGTEVVGGGGDGRLEHLVLRDVDHGRRGDGRGARAVPHDRRPTVHRLAAADDRAGPTGLRPHRRRTWPMASVWPLERRPFLLETSMPGVFAAGDVRHGAVKRVASAVGEGSIAIQFLHQLFAVEPPTARESG